MPQNGGSYGVKIPWNKGISTENVMHEPTFTAYELRLLWHTDPPLLCHMNRFYWGWGWSLICWDVTLLNSVEQKEPSQHNLQQRSWITISIVSSGTISEVIFFVTAKSWGRSMYRALCGHNYITIVTALAINITLKCPNSCTDLKPKSLHIDLLLQRKFVTVVKRPFSLTPNAATKCCLTKN